MENEKLHDDNGNLELYPISYIIGLIIMLSFFVGMFTYFKYYKKKAYTVKNISVKHAI